MTKKATVLLGMSGGVDSSVSLVLLLEQGYDVTCVFMKNWDDEGDEFCTQADDYLDVVRVCDQLGVKYYTVNFEKEYKDRVFSYFLEEYQRGRTPNPDVMCNTEIKFKAFLDFAMKMNCDYIAMGHYARTKTIDGRTYLLKGADPNKDQSYFLSRVTEEALAKTLFPVGALDKRDVRAIAEANHLATARKKDSTGICFIGERNFNAFLDQFLFTKPGDIYSYEGEKLGRHSGLMHYTIGQRKGIGLGGMGNGEPFFVQWKDLKHNRLIVAQGIDHPALYIKETWVSDPFWITATPTFPLQCAVKIRYRAKDEEATVEQVGEKLKVTFNHPLKGVTPGQIMVFYDKDICLGSGIID
ncbi:tRNA 2-thiouridine(34) synthase MnmA [Peptoniphilus equinus]|uniref:tRNA-specific 2-thiouridylase MnmA n=1 Tax=Peptoniphilus equinus TaxID=3016343 RepID=A0ABY7QUG8_9FIRM|nr:tRNA 2-thiouridine(34) synthase MnmA [Peptoniphilus equinus]WBW50434.1 tRNA 2-thiouridine(34) synthase MnmA [Peptoniphilus equinus]